MKTDWPAFFIKTSVLVAIFATLDFGMAFLASFVLTLVYQYFIAAALGLKVMPTMDACCFVGSDKAIANLYSIIIVDYVSHEDVQNHFKRLQGEFPKNNYTIKMILGDYYYQPNTVESVKDYVIQKIPKEMKNLDEIERFIEADINVQMPLDKPQWLMYHQEKYIDGKSLFIWKSHHSYGDGVSVMSYHLTHGLTYDVRAMMPIRPVPWWQRMLLRISFPFYIPTILLKQLTTNIDRNPLHNGNRVLTGQKKVAASKDISFKRVKLASKKVKVTINDFMTVALSASLKQYFEQNGDKDTKSCQIILPANIRFGHYQTRESLKLENKFAPIALRIPLGNLNESLEAIPRTTSQLHKAFGEIYATYALSYYSAMFSPYFMQDWFIERQTQPFTLAFSNTPGILKPIKTLNGGESHKMTPFMIASGKCGIGISLLSYVEYINVQICADTGVMKDPAKLLHIMEDQIEALIKKSGITQEEVDEFTKAENQRLKDVSVVTPSTE